VAAATVVLGVDPGTRHTGFGLVAEVEGRLVPLDWGVISPRPSLALPDKLYYIHTALQARLEAHQPSAMAVETLFLAKNVRSAVTLAHARGVALLTAAAAGLEVVEYSPLEVKQAVVGYGRADKQQVQVMVQALLHTDQPVQEADAADALAVAICHLHSLRLRASIGHPVVRRARS
jgi:crossover junction endodeoxyribonuclease RuvC